MILCKMSHRLARVSHCIIMLQHKENTKTDLFLIKLALLGAARACVQQTFIGLYQSKCGFKKLLAHNYSDFAAKVILVAQ